MKKQFFKYCIQFLIFLSPIIIVGTYGIFTDPTLHHKTFLFLGLAPCFLIAIVCMSAIASPMQVPAEIRVNTLDVDQLGNIEKLARRVKRMKMSEANCEVCYKVKNPIFRWCTTDIKIMQEDNSYKVIFPSGCSKDMKKIIFNNDF